MKKTFWSLAALMLMAAPVMTSCSNDLDEATPIEEVKSNVVTITIAPPAASRVAMGPDGLTIAGWEEGDVVTVYKATPGVGEDPIKGIEEAPAKVVGEGLIMTCTDPSAGTFSGTLADGEKIDDYNLAIFGGTAENYWNDDFEIGGINIKPTTWSSTELKDVVMMGAIKEGQSFTMKIINNVMKIENAATSDIEAAWYGYDYSIEENFFFELASQLATMAGESWAWKGYMINDQSNSWATVPHITLAKNAINYVNFPMIHSVFDDEDKIGLYMSDETAVVPMKSVEGRISDGYSSTYCGRLINAGTYAPAATTGTAKRTGDIDVTWVQLWEDGPKFAEYNVGAANNKAEDWGGYYCWGSSIDQDSNGAYKSGSEALTGTDDTATNLWGDNWRMPTQAELQALLANCNVAWTTVNGVKGRKFTGKGDYASNSVFLPAAGFYNRVDVLFQGDRGYYWSSTPDGSAYAFFLLFRSKAQSMEKDSRSGSYSVRAVLAE